MTTEVVAFYLPQFHPIPENDAWWGKGFTEWRNVAAARPFFPGHVQPRLPADLGFYDLRVSETREAQAELARSYGVTAFCYYHYWFDGRRLLERPFDEVLESGRPDFPFMLCWANENWTRLWDGRDREILMPQSHSLEDDRRHLRVLAQAFADPRYVRWDGKPVFLVYRTELLPDPRRTAEVWREEAARLGIGEIMLGRVEGMAWDIDPRSIGFDFAVEFAPRWNLPLVRSEPRGIAEKLKRSLRRSTSSVYSYDDLVEQMLGTPAHSYPFVRCACPSWDNTPRRRSSATVFHGASPAAFKRWVSELVARGRDGGRAKRIFVNSWNEWAEGAQLEPCSVFGHGFLQALREALADHRSEREPARAHMV
jgi:lipopolysaccharide biosynthesis protein